MMDVLFYRDAVLEIILEGQHIALEVCALRYDLFLHAAKYFFRTKNAHFEVLEPFPHCFFDFNTKTRRYNELEECIATIPQLGGIDKFTTLPESTWELLHWIFTNPLKIKVQKESETSEYFTDELRNETQLMTIPYPSLRSLRYEITHPNSNQGFLALKGRFGSFYAYHGSPGHNFHSIIHRGLRSSLNIRKAYGPGTYLTSYLDTASSYANEYGFAGVSMPYSGRYHSASLLCVRYCVAVVEVIKHPTIKIINFDAAGAAINPNEEPLEPNFDDTSSKHHKYYVVNSDELMRMKHLLVFY